MTWGEVINTVIVTEAWFGLSLKCKNFITQSSEKLCFSTITTNNKILITPKSYCFIYSNLLAHQTLVWMGYYYSIAAAVTEDFYKWHFQWCYEAETLHGYFKWFWGTLVKIWWCFDYLGPIYGEKGGILDLVIFSALR